MVALTADEIMTAILSLDFGAETALEKSKKIRSQLQPYQAAALFILARQYNRKGNRLLDIGTLAGYSASIMAQAAPLAEIITLNPATNEIPGAVANLGGYQNVSIVAEASWDYLENYNGHDFNLVFVDGDHKRVRLDLPWWGKIKRKGLMLFHDYSPDSCPPVYQAVNEMSAKLKQKLDVVILDNQKIGLAGFYKR